MKDEECVPSFDRSLLGNVYLEEKERDGKIPLRWNLERQDVKMRTGCGSCSEIPSFVYCRNIHKSKAKNLKSEKLKFPYPNNAKYGTAHYRNLLNCRSDKLTDYVTGFVTFSLALTVTVGINSGELRRRQSPLTYNKTSHIKSQCHTTLDFVTKPATTSLSGPALCVLHIYCYITNFTKHNH
jgi:hypothetical protein